jgi:hypothetical protein
MEEKKLGVPNRVAHTWNQVLYFGTEYGIRIS